MVLEGVLATLIGTAGGDGRLIDGGLAGLLVGHGDDGMYSFSFCLGFVCCLDRCSGKAGCQIWCDEMRKVNCLSQVKDWVCMG